MAPTSRGLVTFASVTGAVQACGRGARAASALLGTATVYARVWLLGAALGLAGCGPNPEVEERLRYWESEVGSFAPNGRPLNELHPWLRSRDVYYTFDTSDIVDGRWTVGLERVYTHTPRCEWMDIRLRMRLDDSQEIQSHEIVQEGSCLW